MNPKIKLWISSICQQGMARRNIEDCLLVRNHSRERYALLGVFDGMGGLDNGEVACTEACRAFNTPLLHSPAQELISRAKAANHSLRVGPEKQGVTVSIVIIDKYEMDYYALSIGDSRIYRYYDLKLEQISEDDKPLIGKSSIFSSSITNAIGISDELNDIEIISGKVKDNDKWLITTDGIHDKLNEKFIKDIIMMSNKSLVTIEIAKQSINRASQDDLTAIFFLIQQDRQ